MNAQEAIEVKEEVLAQMKLNLRGVIENPYGHLMDDKEELVKELEQEIEALSIVLESAKRLEKIRDEALSYSGIEDLDVNNVELFNFSKWVYDVSEGFEVSE